MKQIRTGIFETNSSSTHTISIYYNDTSIFETAIDIDDDCEFEDLCFDESDIDKLLSLLPIEKLRKELERRENDQSTTRIVRD